MRSLAARIARLRSLLLFQHHLGADVSQFLREPRRGGLGRILPCLFGVLLLRPALLLRVPLARGQALVLLFDLPEARALILCVSRSVRLLLLHFHQVLGGSLQYLLQICACVA